MAPGAKDYRRNNLAHPCSKGGWVDASQSRSWKQSLSWEIYVLASSPSFCSSLQTQAGFFFAVGFKQPEYFLDMICTWLGTGGWLVGPEQLVEADGQVAHSPICSEIRAKRAPDNPRTC